jgi:hypothetical protein
LLSMKLGEVERGFNSMVMLASRMEMGLMGF